MQTPTIFPSAKYLFEEKEVEKKFDHSFFYSPAICKLLNLSFKIQSQRKHISAQ